MGGWWLTCSAMYFQPFPLISKVSPRTGLKGLVSLEEIPAYYAAEKVATYASLRIESAEFAAFYKRLSSLIHSAAF